MLHVRHGGFATALRVFLCATLLTACGGGGGGSNKSGGDTTTPSAILRFVNAIPDAPTLLLQRGDVLIGSAAFGASSVGYTATDIGANEVNLVYLDTDGNQVTIREGLSVDLAADREVYMLFTGTFASPIATVIDNPIVQTQTDSDGNEIPITTLGVQFAESASLGGNVDIYLTKFGAPLADATPTATLGFGEVSDQVTVTADDDFEIRVTPVGSTDPIYDSGQITLAAARNQVFLLLDYFGPGDNVLRIASIANGSSSTLANASLPSELRLAHFVANTSMVDLYLNDTNDAPEFTGIGFGDFSDFVALEAGEYPVNVTPPGDNLTFLYEHNLVLAPGESRTLVITGDADTEDSIAGVAVIDDKRPVATELRLQFVHAGWEAGNVDFYLLEPGAAVADSAATISTVEYLGTRTMPVASGNYDLVVTAAGDDTTVLAGPTPISIDVAAWTVLLVGSASGGPPYDLVTRRDAVE